MRRLQLFVIGTSVLIAAGCGDGRHFGLGATRACLDARGYKTSTENNWLFKPTEGTLDVLFGRRYVSLNFGKDGQEARRIRDSALQADSHWPIGVRANVAYVWSVGAKTRVGGVLECLRGFPTRTDASGNGKRRPAPNDLARERIHENGSALESS